MPYFIVEPEVAGGLGDRTEMDRSVHPPVVTRLHYQFDGWLGDALVESFPAFIVTEAASEALIAAGLTGVEFSEAEIATTETFREFYPGRDLPSFVWLKPVGQAARDDFGTAADGRLVVSQRALDVLRECGLDHAVVEAFDT